MNKFSYVGCLQLLENYLEARLEDKNNLCNEDYYLHLIECCNHLIDFLDDPRLVR